MKKKFALTILEVMVVIFIIGIVGTVVGINMKGSLEQGKAFKSEKGSKQVYEILSLEAAKDDDVITMIENGKAKHVLANSGLPQDADKLMKDGWGNLYAIDVVDGEIKVTSKAYIKYLREKKKSSDKSLQDKLSWMVVTAKK